jgi:hypothetical protein
VHQIQTTNTSAARSDAQSAATDQEAPATNAIAAATRPAATPILSRFMARPV